MFARLFEWFISSPPATLLAAVGAIISAMALFRKQSHGEHRTTLKAINGVGEQVNGNLLERLNRIESRIERLIDRHGISEADQ